MMYKLLIVDDELWTRNSIKALGEWDRLGIEIVGEARDGIEGLQLIESLQPHIVITDMNMPGMDGVGLLKVMQEQYQQIKAVVISGYDDFNYARQAIRSNAQDYILKPVDPKELNDTLEKCITELVASEASKEMSAYILARNLDNSLIEKIREEKKIVRRLLADCNQQGIRNSMERLRKLFDDNVSDQRTTGCYLGKVFAEVALEQLLTLENNQKVEPELEKALSTNRPVHQTISEAIDWIGFVLADTIKYMNQCKNDQESSTLCQVKKYVEKNYMEKISLESIARTFFISKEYLSKAYKQKYGTNLMNHITELRMRKAEELIKDPDISIKSIAETVGYDDISHFYHVFKNYHHISPGELRKEFTK